MGVCVFCCVDVIIIISKYLYSAKFTNKCALDRCLIKYIVIHCIQHMYINIHMYTYTHICVASSQNSPLV